MKHIKNIEIFETRIYKNLKKFSEFLKNKFGANKVMIYEEDGINVIVLEFLYYTFKENIKLRNNVFGIFKDFDIQCFGSIGVSKFKIKNVSNDFINQLELEMNAQKYNL